MRNYIIPALINDLKNNFPEQPLLLEQLGALEPSTLPMGTQTVQAYSNQLRPLVARFGGADHHIVNEASAVLRYVILNHENDYASNKTNSMAEFWKWALHLANKQGLVEIGELKPFLSKIIAAAPGSVVVEKSFSAFFLY